MQRDLVKDRAVLCQETTTFTTTRLSSLATPHSILNSFTAHHSRLVQTLGFLSNKPSTICISVITKYRNISTTLKHDGCMAAFTCSKSKWTRDLIANQGWSCMPSTKLWKEKWEYLEQKYNAGQIFFLLANEPENRKKKKFEIVAWQFHILHHNELNLNVGCFSHTSEGYKLMCAAYKIVPNKN